MAGKLIWVTLIRASQHCLKGREIMAFLDNVEKFFGSKNLYAALGVEKTAKDSELRRAYHRLSLRVHPDRVSPEEVAEATEKFQVMNRMRAIGCKISSVRGETITEIHAITFTLLQLAEYSLVSAPDPPCTRKKNKKKRMSAGRVWGRD